METNDKNNLWKKYLEATGKKDYEKAISILNELLKIKKTPDFYVRKGRLLKSLGRYDEALECLDKALKLKPDYSRAYFLKGVLLMSLGRLKESKEVFLKLLELDKQESNIGAKCITATI